ncbi:MAG TPA: hypothetical protein VN253_25295, partial [Kofleriaceae bacterium]|nr:hypothetical protein [Kofleriaceae bacterium]
LFGLGDRKDFALATFSFFAQAGAHTFHEVMLMAKATGFSDYVPGNYLSAIPEKHRTKLKSDLSAHADLLQDPVAATEEEHAQDGTLHGWKDVLTLDGDVAGWAAKVKAFLANRFGVDAEHVTVTAVTDGRSGDMVYKVDVAREEGAFKGIFKVFHNADVADTEIQIGEKMKKDLKVNTPSNHGVARVEAEDGSASKAGVLFDRAEGKSPHELVKEIGALDKAAEGRKPLITQLQQAVVAVAKQLSKLHGKAKAGNTGRVATPTELKAKDLMAKDVKQVHEKGLYTSHLAVAAEHLEEAEVTALGEAFDKLLEDNVVKQKLRKSMTHGDANAGNFIVDGDEASIIDVNTGVQSLGPTGDAKKTGAADTGRFLESLRTAYPGALTEEELAELDKQFHTAYLPGSDAFPEDKTPTKKEEGALKKIDDEKAADEKAEVYYRACWVLNQLSHAKEAPLRRTLKERLIALIPELDGKLELG